MFGVFLLVCLFLFGGLVGGFFVCVGVVFKIYFIFPTISIFLELGSLVEKLGNYFFKN